MTEATIALRECLRNVGMDLDGDSLRESIATRGSITIRPVANPFFKEGMK